MSYNLSAVTAANNTLDMFTAINTDLTGGLLGNFILLALGILLFLSMSYYSAKDAFLFTSFILTVVSMLLATMGIVHFFMVVACTGMMFIAVIIHKTT